MPELSLAKRASRSRKTRISSFEFSADQIEAVRQLVGRTIADVECELIIKTLADQRSVPCEIRSTNTMSMEKSCPNQPLIEYCPLWVISGHFAMRADCSLYARKRTFAVQIDMSAKCLERTQPQKKKDRLAAVYPPKGCFGPINRPA